MTDVIQHIKSILKSLPTDVRVEVVISQLIENGMDLMKFLIRPRSVFRRGYRKDIIKVDLQDFETGREEYIAFDITRQGIYDQIPEGLMHQPVTKKHIRSGREKTEMIKRHRREQQDARNFFLPFELEIYRQRVLLEMEERNTLVGFSNPFQHDWFIRFWGLSNQVRSSQIASLLYLLPVSHKIVGNLKLTELCFETILGEKMKLRYGRPIKQSIKEYLKPLGESKLGVSFVIGNVLNEGIRSIEVVIGPLKEANVIDFLFGGKEYHVLKILVRYFLPVEADVQTTILVKDDEKNFILSQEKYTGRLGYTCNI